VENIKAYFQSCLYGSEPAVTRNTPAVSFQSCLYGSEQQYYHLILMLILVLGPVSEFNPLFSEVIHPL